ncbi:hypothetical protein CWR48_02220 [Oceanobacillus arenosus]|uniref:Uncharacterized protein n=1 Tax=Oceanobacillus arenosus TaxID=1229153 RepID=A0A3D8Q0T2_9BACI|nr:hypothetical protein [Oceanobacillus arenosus]RDW21874.1 hypothetical protein CWR48_02220 [Oceanobacillus arenosus]
MVLVVYVIIAMYALLTIIAGVSQLIAKTFHVNHFIFIVLSIMMLASLFIHDKQLMIIGLIIIFIGMHIVAIIEGFVMNGELAYSHHIVRFIVHIIIIVMVLLFIK